MASDFDRVHERLDDLLNENKDQTVALARVQEKQEAAAKSHMEKVESLRKDINSVEGDVKEIRKDVASLKDSRSRIKGVLYSLPFIGGGGGAAFNWEVILKWLGMKP